VSTFPNRLADRAAITIAKTARLVNTAHQRLNVIGSQVASLTPGSWELLTLENGWSNLSGYVPAQVRLQQGGLAYLIGHITGGTTSNGTLIAVLGSGFYNTVHAHQFTANVLAGASAVSVSSTSGTISGTTDSNGLSGPATQGTSGEVNGGSAGNSDHTHSAGSYEVTSGQHVHTNLDGNQVPATTTPVNYNTVTLNLDTSGNLTIQNCSSEATQISFSEHLPLVTS